MASILIEAIKYIDKLLLHILLLDFAMSEN